MALLSGRFVIHVLASRLPAAMRCMETRLVANLSDSHAPRGLMYGYNNLPTLLFRAESEQRTLVLPARSSA